MLKDWYLSLGRRKYFERQTEYALADICYCLKKGTRLDILFVSFHRSSKRCLSPSCMLNRPYGCRYAEMLVRVHVCRNTCFILFCFSITVLFIPVIIWYSFLCHGVFFQRSLYRLKYSKCIYICFGLLLHIFRLNKDLESSIMLHKNSLSVRLFTRPSIFNGVPLLIESQCWDFAYTLYTCII